MKHIVFQHPDDTIEILTLCEGFRLVRGITLADGRKIRAKGGKPVPVDTFFRYWPVMGVEADWAETEEAFIDRVWKKDVPAWARNVRIVDPAEIPTDRSFRDAWRLHEDKIMACMNTAKEIHRDRLRARRKSELESLDVAYQIADESGNVSAKKSIVARKKKLRDLPEHPEIDQAKTLEALKVAGVKELEA